MRVYDCFWLLWRVSVVGVVLLPCGPISLSGGSAEKVIFEGLSERARLCQFFPVTRRRLQRRQKQISERATTHKEQNGAPWGRITL